MQRDNVIDISHWQIIPEMEGFDKIKESGIRGVIHKATESLHNIDSKYVNRKKAFIERGYLFGSYHFLRRDGMAEAKRFLDVVKPTDTELIALDAEAQNLTLNQLMEESERFVETVKCETGRYPFFYINNFMLNHYDFRGSVLVNCPLWIARYSKRQPVIPAPFTKWTLWQYTQEGRIQGILGDVDRNYFNGVNLEDVWAK